MIIHCFNLSYVKDLCFLPNQGYSDSAQIRQITWKKHRIFVIWRADILQSFVRVN